MQNLGPSIQYKLQQLRNIYFRTINFGPKKKRVLLTGGPLKRIGCINSKRIMAKIL